MPNEEGITTIASEYGSMPIEDYGTCLGFNFRIWKYAKITSPIISSNCNECQLRPEVDIPVKASPAPTPSTCQLIWKNAAGNDRTPRINSHSPPFYCNNTNEFSSSTIQYGRMPTPGSLSTSVGSSPLMILSMLNMGRMPNPRSTSQHFFFFWNWKKAVPAQPANKVLPMKILPYHQIQAIISMGECQIPFNLQLDHLESRWHPTSSLPSSLQTHVYGSHSTVCENAIPGSSC